MTKVIYKVYVDWDCTDWAGAHFVSDTTGMSDISSYVKKPIRIAKGAKPDDWLYPAATLEVKLNNTSGVFYPTLATGALYGLIRVWLPIKVDAVVGVTTYHIYYGYINAYTTKPLLSEQDVYLYATDGMDLLAKTIVIQDMDNKTLLNDGVAFEEVLDAAGWNAARRIIDVSDPADIINLPDTFAFAP